MDLLDVWLKEVDCYFMNKDCIMMLVGSKVDLEESGCVVMKKEGIVFVR